MSLKPRLFGTDGIRGVAGEYPLDRPTIVKLGRALGVVLARDVASRRPEVLVGIDTRESGRWIARVLAAGLRIAGAESIYAGVITTPGLAFLTRHHGFAAGVMVSASHNPFQDNGIKVLSAAGIKLEERVELAIERTISRLQEVPTGDSELKAAPGLVDEYLDFLASLALSDGWQTGFRLVADCANGSASHLAGKLFDRLGIEASLINASPDGRNINLNSGSLHPEAMARDTRSAGATLGVAFDGDADRSIFAATDGRVLDGDHVLFAAAPYLDGMAMLKGRAVVGTVMTNFGLELALRDRGIGLKRTAVGDRFVLEEMLRSGVNLGGEPSGHVIFSDISPAGDGFVTLIEMLRLIAASGASAADLVRNYTPFPQLIRNVTVRAKPPLESVPEVAAALARCQDDLEGRGRVVLRYSGTEPLARVMVEGERPEPVERHVTAIAAAIEKTLGNGVAY